MAKKGKTPLGHARSRQTRSEINVQTPTGLQNLELLINLGFGEAQLLQDIGDFFRDERHMYRDRIRDRVFLLVYQIIEKIADGTIPLEFMDYYDGDLGNEMDHANIYEMRRLLLDTGDILRKRMYNPGIAQAQDRAGEMTEVVDEDGVEHERLRTTDEWF